MFKPVKMRKVNLFALSEDTKKVTDVLYDLKLIEFFDISPERFEKFEDVDLNVISGKLLRTRSTIAILKSYFEREEESVSSKPIQKTLEFKEKLDEIKREILHLEDEMKRQKILSGIGVKESELNETTIGFIPLNKAKLLKLFDKEKVKYKKFKHEERVYFSVKTKDIEFPYKEFYLPKKSVASLDSELANKKEMFKKTEESLTKLANNNLIHLQKKELKLSKEVSFFEVKHKFAKTSNVVVLSGYVPKNEIRKLKEELEKTLADKFNIEESEAGEDAPIKLRNGIFSNKFEALLKMYSLPNYGELDPTLLMFLVFPIFFGFILGDVGYGFISLIIFTIAKFKFKEVKDFISILQLSAFFSILFGVIYGEYFGFELYGIFSRIQNPELLLFFAVIFGIIHINIGLIVGFINEMKNIKKAVYDKASWIIMELAVAVLALGVYSKASNAIVVGMIFLILSFFLIYKGHGFIGLIEIPSFFTNILSYARLMAVGLSSIAIAMLVNEYTKVLFAGGIVGIISGIFLFTFGHIFNIVLGNFESFLHTLRLHYVEFFTKFYTGGGREFVPFGERIRIED